MRLKKTLAAAGTSAALMLFTLTPAAQAQVQLENNSIVIESTVTTCGGPCRIMDIDGGDMLLGESVAGTTSGEDIDLEIMDGFSQLGGLDRAFNLNASLSDLQLGSGSSTTPGDAGDINIENGEGGVLLDFDGNSGNIFQDVDNVAIINGNGAIKAWAKMNSTGTIDSCWRCNTSVTQTRRLLEGQYEVDFLLGNINQRPCLVSSGDHGLGDNLDHNVECYDSSDLSSKNVETNLVSTSVDDDADFTIVIF